MLPEHAKFTTYLLDQPTTATLSYPPLNNESSPNKEVHVHRITIDSFALFAGTAIIAREGGWAHD